MAVVVICVQESRVLIDTIQHTPQSICWSKKEVGKRKRDQKVRLQPIFITLAAEKRNEAAIKKK